MKKELASGMSVPLNEVGNMIQQLDEKISYIYQSLAQKNDEQGERLAGLIAVTNFEITLAEQLVQRKYYFDPKGKSIYEELRGAILQTMAVNHEKSNTVELLELREKLRVLEIDQMKLQTEKDKVQTEKDKEIERARYLQKRYEELVHKYEQTVDGLKAYSRLAKWHENLVQEVPAIRKKNSGIIRVKTWEGAVECYIRDNPKPKVTEIDINDFR